MRLPQDKVNLTWGQIREVLGYLTDKISQLERVEDINSCYEEDKGSTTEGM